MIVSPETAWEDDSEEDDRRFGLNAVRTGDYLTVQGYGSGIGITATRVERDDDDDWEEDDD